jgi:hypothetical protein
MNCEEVIILKGQDCNLNIELRDQAGNLIDATPFKIVTVIKTGSGFEIAKFSKNSASGYYPMDCSNEALGVISVKLLSEHTMLATEGKLYQETHLQITDASRTDDGVLDLISPSTYCCTIRKSNTGGLTLP